MSTDTLLAAADVLEKCAAYIDEQISVKVAAVVQAHQDQADTLAKAYRDTFGAELTSTQTAKLAADEEYRRLVADTLEKAASVAPMGTSHAAGGKPPPPANRAEARQRAYDNFANDVTS